MIVVNHEVQSSSVFKSSCSVYRFSLQVLPTCKTTNKHTLRCWNEFKIYTTIHKKMGWFSGSIFKSCPPAKQQTNTHSDAEMSSKFIQLHRKNGWPRCNLGRKAIAAIDRCSIRPGIKDGIIRKILQGIYFLAVHANNYTKMGVKGVAEFGLQERHGGEYTLIFYTSDHMDQRYLCKF